MGQTMNTSEGNGSSYQVVILGELRPAVLAFCTRPPADHQTSGVFQLRLRDGQGIADLAATLHAAALTILSIRQVTPAEVWAPAAPRLSSSGAGDDAADQARQSDLQTRTQDRKDPFRGDGNSCQLKTFTGRSITYSSSSPETD
jgi:hypothetical protein